MDDLRKAAINLLNGARLEVQVADLIPRNITGAVSRAALRKIFGRKSEVKGDFDASPFDLVDEAVGACAKIADNCNSLF